MKLEILAVGVSSIIRDISRSCRLPSWWFIDQRIQQYKRDENHLPYSYQNSSCSVRVLAVKDRRSCCQFAYTVHPSPTSSCQVWYPASVHVCILNCILSVSHTLLQTSTGRNTDLRGIQAGISSCILFQAHTIGYVPTVPRSSNANLRSQPPTESHKTAYTLGCSTWYLVLHSRFRQVLVYSSFCSVIVMFQLRRLQLECGMVWALMVTVTGLQIF